MCILKQFMKLCLFLLIATTSFNGTAGIVNPDQDCPEGWVCVSGSPIGSSSGGGGLLGGSGGGGRPIYDMDPGTGPLDVAMNGYACAYSVQGMQVTINSAVAVRYTAATASFVRYYNSLNPIGRSGIVAGSVFVAQYSDGSLERWTILNPIGTQPLSQTPLVSTPTPTAPVGTCNGMA